MKILPILQPLKQNGFDPDVLTTMTCNTICLHRIQAGMAEKSAALDTLSDPDLVDEIKTIRDFFTVRTLREENNVQVLTAACRFIDARIGAIVDASKTGQGDLPADLLIEDLREFRGYVQSALQNLDHCDLIPQRLQKQTAEMLEWDPATRYLAQH